MILLLIPVVGLAIAIGINFGWRWVLAPLLAWVLLRWLLGSLRALASSGAPGLEHADPTVLAPDERTLYWCEECGAELLLLVRGTTLPPRHCGQKMHERTELPTNN